MNGVVGLFFPLIGPKTQEQETTCCPGPLRSFVAEQSECQGFYVPRVHLSALTQTTAFHLVRSGVCTEKHPPESIPRLIAVDTWLDL